MQTIIRFAAAVSLVALLSATAAVAQVSRASDINIDGLIDATPADLAEQFPSLSDAERAKLLFRIADANSLRQ